MYPENTQILNDALLKNLGWKRQRKHGRAASYLYGRTIRINKAVGSEDISL